MSESKSTATIETVEAADDATMTLNHFQYATYRTRDGRTARMPVSVAGDRITLDLPEPRPQS